MATLILVRHGRTSANASGTLAGRLPGVRSTTSAPSRPRVRPTRLAWCHSPRSSPARSSAAGRPRRPSRAPTRPGRGPQRTRADGVRLRRLAGPAAQGARQGEAVGDRPVAAVRRRPSRAASRCRRCRRARSTPYAAATPPSRPSTAPARSGSRSATATSSSRSWPTRSGMHLDLFQRIQVDPASVSIVRYTSSPPLRAGHQHPRRRPVLAGRRPPSAAAKRADAAVGGGAGPAGLRAPPRVAAWPVVHGFDPPERFVAGHRRPARPAHLLPPGPRAARAW